MIAFAERVRRVVMSIPKGSVLTYKQVAQKAGRPNASRVVGTILAKNIDTSVPCHRVVRSDGALGGYNGLRGEKAKLLKKEGAIS